MKRRSFFGGLIALFVPKADDLPNEERANRLEEMAAELLTEANRLRREEAESKGIGHAS